MFAAQLANTVTAIWCCTRCIIIPQVIQAVCINTSQRTSVTYLKDYVERAWCSFEAMAALLSGTEVYCSFQIGSAMAHQKFDRPEGAASGLGFYTSNVNAYNYFMHNRSRDFKKVNKDTLDSLWDAVEPCKMLSLIVGIARKGRGEYSEILEKSQSLAVQLCDAGHKGRSELRELWDRMGQCTVDDDKLVVFNMMLFIGFYRMRVWEQRKEELCQGCTGDGMICAPGEGCSVM
uniref:Uncharacterized protein n=1 Tax=Fibrocapsa japonica TaxID=94617 RepID=A0A7S2UTE3_9STRA